MGIYIIFIAFSLLAYYVSAQLKNKFNQYSDIRIPSGLSGKEIAEKMLRDNGIYDVRVIQNDGILTDHYNPLNKTVNLSQAVYSQSNVTAAAVAAHECGHAVQHAKAYPWLQMRSKLVPAVNFSSGVIQWVLLGGILLLKFTSLPLLIGVILFSVTTLFSFITLPVEFDASERALQWLKKTGIAGLNNQYAAKDALRWAAYTYVIAALQSLTTLVYYALILLGNRRNQ